MKELLINQIPAYYFSLERIYCHTMFKDFRAPSGHGTPSFVDAHVAHARQRPKTPKPLKEWNFYTAGLLCLSRDRQRILIAPIPTDRLMRGLAFKEVNLIRQPPHIVAQMRLEYYQMLARKEFKRPLMQQFFDAMQQNCRRLHANAPRAVAPSFEQLRAHYATYDLHHRIPLSLGGTNKWNNLVLLPRSLHQAVHKAIDRNTVDLPLNQPVRCRIPFPNGIASYMLPLSR